MYFYTDIRYYTLQRYSVKFVVASMKCKIYRFIMFKTVTCVQRKTTNHSTVADNPTVTEKDHLTLDLYVQKLFRKVFYSIVLVCCRISLMVVLKWRCGLESLVRIRITVYFI